jgi:succinoglycan biosynthesis protein ExoA
VTSPAHPPLVSIVIPCRNEEAHLSALLDAVRRQEMPPHEVLVVDCGSTDATRAIVREYQRCYVEWPLRLLTSLRYSSAAAMNVGIGVAAGDFIVRLDGHCVPRPDYVRRSVQRLQEDGNGVVGGMWEVAAGRDTRVGHAIAAAMSHRLATGGAAYRHPTCLREPAVVDTVPYGCFRKTLWSHLGGYDARPVSEDYLFNYRARLAGWRVVLDPTIRCAYFARATFRQLAAQYFKYGWHKAEMLKLYPGALRWRQVVPGAFTAIVLLLMLLGCVMRPAWLLLAAILVGYAIVASAAAVQLGATKSTWPSVPLYAVAFGLIHFAWGIGACVNLATLGRWPYENTAEPASDERNVTTEAG